MAEQQKKPIVFSAFAVSLSGNRGAVSMLQSAIDNLTAENRAKVNVFSVYYRRDRALPPQPATALFDGTPLSLVFRLTPLAVWWRILRWFGLRKPPGCFGRHFLALWESDVALMLGGTTFTDAQKIKIVYNVFCLLPSIILGQKIVMYSQTVGPFRSRINRTAARLALSRTRLVVPRGQESLRQVKSLNLPERVKVEYYDDAAFTLKVPAAVRRKIETDFAGRLGRRPLVGISVNSIVQRKCRNLGIDYLGAWSEFIEYLAANHYGVLLIPHSMRPGARTDHNNDLFAVDYLEERMSEVARANTVIVRTAYDCKELREVVALADLYVASRFHSMISALCIGVPVLVFGWGFQKYIEVMKEFELEEYCFDARDISGERLIAEFRRLEENRDVIREKIAGNRAKVEASSRKNHESSLAVAAGEPVPAGTPLEL